MNNFHQNPQKELDQSIMEWLSDHSATIIVLATLATFLLTGYFEFFFYLEVFGSQIPSGFAVAVAVALPLVIQGIRAATVTNSAKKFRQGLHGRGSFILFMSLIATVYCSFEMVHLANFWDQDRGQYQAAVLLAMQFLVWAGYGLEIVLAVSVSGEKRLAATPAHNTRIRPKQEEAFDLDPLLNGNGAKH